MTACTSGSADLNSLAHRSVRARDLAPALAQPQTLADSRGSRQGFSLLEMIVAIALLGMAVAGLISMINTSLSGSAMTREYERAAMLAKTRMNDLLVMRPIPLSVPLSGEFNDSSGWEARAEPYDRFGFSATGSRLVRVTLTVWWNSGGERKTLDLEGFRRVRVR